MNVLEFLFASTCKYTASINISINTIRFTAITMLITLLAPMIFAAVTRAINTISNETLLITINSQITTRLYLGNASVVCFVAFSNRIPNTMQKIAPANNAQCSTNVASINKLFTQYRNNNTVINIHHRKKLRGR